MAITKVIKHAEISSVTAGKLGKGATTESVMNTVNEYANSVSALLDENKTTNPKDNIIMETPLMALRLIYHENGIKKNADGTETKIGDNYSIKVALPNTILRKINSKALEGLEKVVSGVAKVIANS